jgi:tetraacyldisaccharide 4'-kinase
MNLPPALRLALWPFSLVYGIYVRVRPLLYSAGLLKPKRLKGAVVSVGNLTLGGTGKTPIVIWLAEKLLAQGKRVAILSRGYRGSENTSDEIEVMKLRLQGRTQFGVGKDRFASGQRLESQQPVDVFLLDDGFQHMQLARDLDVLLVDASRPMGREFLLPAGRMREPVSAMGRADVLVFTRTEALPGTTEAISKLRDYPVFAAQTRLLGFRRLGGDLTLLAPDAIGEGPFLAFCGLGNPEAFFRDLVNWKYAVCSTMAFPDHHRYSPEDVSRFQQEASAAQARALLTTEKDEQNLKGQNLVDPPVYVCVIDFVIGPEADFLNILAKAISAPDGAAA